MQGAADTRAAAACKGAVQGVAAVDIARRGRSAGGLSPDKPACVVCGGWGGSSTLWANGYWSGYRTCTSGGMPQARSGRRHGAQTPIVDLCTRDRSQITRYRRRDAVLYAAMADRGSGALAAGARPARARRFRTVARASVQWLRRDTPDGLLALATRRPLAFFHPNDHFPPDAPVKGRARPCRRGRQVPVARRQIPRSLRHYLEPGICGQPPNYS